MPDLKEDYKLSNCCKPEPTDEIVGYYSHDNIIKVHKSGCMTLEKIEKERILSLNWDEIIKESEKFVPDEIYSALEPLDFAVLNHHLVYGFDYSLVLAKKLNIDKQAAFDLHKKLRDLKLIERVEPKIIQYRKGIVDNKWIKHRNHTYYQLTNRGKSFIKYFLAD